MSYSSFINSKTFIVPSKPFIYTPKGFCAFSRQGEQMVNELIEVSPCFYQTFNLLVPPAVQEKVAMESFSYMKELFIEREIKRKEALLNDPVLLANKNLNDKMHSEIDAEESGRTADDQKQKRIGKKFYEQKRQYTLLVPEKYNRTKAPRISTTGSTLHGMKKDLSGKILKTIIRRWQIEGKCYSILDLDMSAAHARFAVALQGSHNTQLFQAVENSGKFWDERATFYHQLIAERDIDLSKAQVRSMLKVSLYTSLNGGNPFGLARLFKNISAQNENLTKNFISEEHFANSQLFKDLFEILSGFELIHEVKALNQECVEDDALCTWTIDRTSPYYIDSRHKGISRALQGYEIVLLSVLVRILVSKGALPINLAHDGCAVIMPGIIDDKALVKQLSDDLKDWSVYLLGGLTLPIECKYNYNVNNTSPNPKNDFNK